MLVMLINRLICLYQGVSFLLLKLMTGILLLNVQSQVGELMFGRLRMGVEIVFMT
ncbi:hypothetical protein D3C71_2045560 [compost metagenome]